MQKKGLLFVSIILICFLTGCAKKCANCNNEIKKDTEVQIGKEYYCENCVEYCAGCNTAFLKDSKELQPIDGKKYCKNCVEYCAGCNTIFVKGSDALQMIDGKKYCENCVEYCAGCKTAFVKGSDKLLTYKKKHYCKDCFDSKAYPISLEDNNKFSFEIIGYDDNNGSFTSRVKNKSKDNMFISQDGLTVLLDAKNKCAAETDGYTQFIHVDVIPPKDEVTIFSLFTTDNEDGGTVIKVSEDHTFEFPVMSYSVPPDGNYDNYDELNYWEKHFKVKLTPSMFGYDD